MRKQAARPRDQRTIVAKTVAAVAMAMSAALLAAGCGRGPTLQAELLAAWVAIQVEGDDVARVGRTEIEAGTPFTLHAVVEAKGWRGRTLYYTEAEALEIHGETVDPESLRPWNRSDRARVLWFTVEGFPPFSENVELGYREVFRANWPLAWSVPGELVPSVENYLPGGESVERVPRFGTQRYRVRVEVLGAASEILPKQSLVSWGADELVEEAERFPTVVGLLPEPAARLSRVFGLPQREPSGENRVELQRTINDWLASDLAFSRLTLLRRWLRGIGEDLESLAWEAVELEGESPWGGAGEPVRAGLRIVWLLQDRGVPGRLDYDDLCLDFERGARVRTLGDVFTGQGIVEHARLIN